MIRTILLKTAKWARSCLERRAVFAALYSILCWFLIAAPAGAQIVGSEPAADEEVGNGNLKTADGTSEVTVKINNAGQVTTQK